MNTHPEPTARYYRADELTLQADVEGAALWEVALDKAMLTYFEVAPESRFERHRHESEQITLVLEGTLYFEVDTRVVRVGRGEVIAIPSWVPHAVFTKGEAVKAVDAWSPVMERYRTVHPPGVTFDEP